jgi:hypothetical protein
VEVSRLGPEIQTTASTLSIPAERGWDHPNKRKSETPFLFKIQSHALGRDDGLFDKFSEPFDAVPGTGRTGRLLYGRPKPDSERRRGSSKF